MSREYVITFHTHYEALVCKRSFEKTEATQTGALAIKLIPVPRELSSSCGTAVKLGVKDEAYFDARFFDGIEHDEVFILGTDGTYVPLTV